MFILGQYNILWILLLIMSVTAMNNNVPDDYTCRRDMSTLTCDFDLPDQWNIPDGITEVYITDYKFNNISQRKYIFKHAKWNVIRTLDIVAKRKYETFILNDNDFVDLMYLKRFGIHSSDYLEIGFYAFVGLYNLSYFDFSGCNRLLSRHLIERLSSENNNFRFDYLNLDNVDDGRGISIDGVFLNMLYVRKVLYLSIRATSIFFIEYFNSFDNVLQLISWDIADSIVSIVSEKHRGLVNVTNIFRNLKYINASGIILSQVRYRTSNGFICEIKLVSVETIDFSRLNNVPLYNTKKSDLRCAYHLRNIYLRSNAIVTFNSTVYYPPFIELLDLSWNGMELISTTALDGLLNLKSLTLSNNRLFKMEQNPEFKYLFMKLYNLEIINLQNNSFTFLPKHLFKSNTELNTLVLSNNQLEFIDFDIVHLHKLELLDLQKNNIVYLDHHKAQTLVNYFKLRNIARNGTIVFNITNNPFVCSCEHVQFVEWVSKELLYTFNETYTCSLDDKIVSIDSSTLKLTSYLCYRTFVIVGSTVFSSVIIIISGLIGLFYFRKRLRKKRITITNIFLNQLIKGQCDEKYLVFTSYSSYDFLLINNVIEPALKYHLWNQNKIPKHLIVTGDSTIRPGFPLLNEIMRCARAACVMVCLVSQSYCDSQWCQTEVRKAVEQGKPIILLFLEDIKQQNMPDTLWMLFNRNTRSKLVKINGKYEPVAGWDNLCESIVTLASNKHSIDTTERKRKVKQRELIQFDEDVLFL